MIDPSDLHTKSLWQCMIKILTKYSKSEDQQRMHLFHLLIKHCCFIIKLPHLHDFTKWAQFIVALVKLCKYSFRKQSLSPQLAESIINLVLELPDTHEILPVLLSLPTRSSNLAGLHIESEGTKKHLRRVLSKTKSVSEPNTLAETINDLISSQDLDLLAFFSENPTALNPTFIRKLSSNSPQFLSFWLGLMFSPFYADNLASIQKFSCTLVFSLMDKPSTVYPFLRIVLRKLLSSSSSSSSNHRTHPTITQGSLFSFLIAANLSGKVLQSQQYQQVFNSAKKILEQAVAKKLDPVILFWPLASMVNICQECPKPTTCAELGQISSSILQNYDDPRLQRLCLNGLRMALRFCEIADINLVVGSLCCPAVAPALALFGNLSLVDPYNAGTNLDWHQTLERLLLSSFSLSSSIFPTLLLRYCEHYLKFATDISLFEKDSLRHLHDALIPFLQRVHNGAENANKLDVDHLIQVIKEKRIEITSRTLDVHLPPQPEISEEGGPFDDILEKLSDLLSSLKTTQPNNYSIVVQKVMTIIDQSR